MSNSHVLRHDNHAGGASASTTQDAGRLLLRLTIGVLMLLHGVAKLRGGVGPIEGMLAQHNLPGALAYLVLVGEVVAPLLVIVGLWTRPAALVIAINMLVAIALAHIGDLAKLNPQGGWAIELQALYLFGALAIAMLGAGRLSVGAASAGGMARRWN